LAGIAWLLYIYLQLAHEEVLAKLNLQDDDKQGIEIHPDLDQQCAPFKDNPAVISLNW